MKKRTATKKETVKHVPGLYRVSFKAADKKDELNIMNGSGYEVLEGPESIGGLNYYWVARKESIS